MPKRGEGWSPVTLKKWPRAQKFSLSKNRSLPSGSMHSCAENFSLSRELR
jgi:hypothetical protein